MSGRIVLSVPQVLFGALASLVGAFVVSRVFFYTPSKARRSSRLSYYDKLNRLSRRVKDDSADAQRQEMPPVDAGSASFDASRVTIDAATVRFVRATAPLVADNGFAIMRAFYPIMFKNNPECLAFFNKTNQSRELQPRALAWLISHFAQNVDNFVVLREEFEILCHKHCGLNVQPAHYGIIVKNLMVALSEVLGKQVTREFAESWEDALTALSEILMEREAQLYEIAERRRGGWRGWRRFVIDEKTQVAHDTTLIKLVPADGSPDPIDFTPGQFTTVQFTRGQGNPRHYTVVSDPGEQYLQICVRRVSSAGLGINPGVVSTWLQEQEVGFELDMMPPFGVFHGPSDNVLFVSAGIGITPVRSMWRNLVRLKAKNYASVHQDHRRNTHPFADEFQGSRCFARYSQEKTNFAEAGHLDADDVLRVFQATGMVPAETTIVLCGPYEFMVSIAEVIRRIGVKGILAETFGPQLAQGLRPQ